MQIGPYQIENPLVLSPMAGITDRPFRQICKTLGAGITVAEMVGCNPQLWHSRKSKLRITCQDEPGPRIAQIAGADPKQMALAAQYNVKQGAQIIDINMGCPAKKVCNKLAGSALMADEKLAADIISAVVSAVSVPVTLKMRTGQTRQNKNALQLARLAERIGVQSIAIHGRTREDLYKGCAEYDTIAQVKQQLGIPVFANGDINSAEKAKFVLEYTKADGLYIGRAAQGYPWIFREINHYLNTGKILPRPCLDEFRNIVLKHLTELYRFYGEHMGVRIARKHIAWYLQSSGLTFDPEYRKNINKINSTEQQYQQVANFFNQTITHKSKLMDQGKKAA